ncbi:MAG: DEAD/DEAH box helicase [Rhodothermales bacterium]
MGDYASYIRSFIRIEDERIAERVEDELRSGLLWPDPLIQLNPSFEPAERVDDLVNEGVLHPTCADIFRLDQDTGGRRSLRLYRHQADAIRVAQAGRNYVLTTGTGSGKSLSYIVPIVDHVLRAGSGQGIKAIVVYPMNALANSQYGELEKFLGDPTTGNAPATFARYTGQENDAQKKAIVANPPDILLTNYVMLELLMTRPQERNLIKAAEGLRFLVLDELHTYRGRQGADVALLVRRVRDRMGGAGLRCVGTSATMASGGSYAEQQAAVADVATRLFGSEVRTEDVIGETLRRATRAWSSDDGAFIDALTTRLNEGRKEAPPSYEDFIADPLSRWIESVFGVRWDEEASRLARVTPRSLLGNDGAAQELSVLTGVSVEQCAHELEAGLMAGYNAGRDPTSGFRPFAFRLHQFISRGDTVHASPEREGDRYVTVHKQQYVPGNRDKVLLPLAFCRECGQEYYTIRRTADPATGRVQYVPRDLRDQYNDELEGEAGFLYLSTSQPWPEDDAAIAMRLPDDWLEETAGGARLRKDRRKYLPSSVAVTADGLEDPIGQRAAFLTAPFRFCLRCGVAYGSRQRSDFAKLTTLGSEGRSTATTILSLSAVRRLRTEQTLKAEARKLLSFTDNRQDAALQAGHFNDFVEVGLLRGALYRAVEDAGARGIRHDELTQRVADAMRLPFDDYAADPTVRFAAKEDTEHAFRQVLGYRLYRDLRRGWRVTAPNLEQAGLLEIDYRSLDELCDADDIWSGLHPALAEANAATRCHVARALLDYMRRELAVKVDYLDARFQERMQQQSAQRLSGAWAMDEDEKLEVATTVLPRSRKKGDWRGHTFLSARGGFGLLLGRPTTFGHLNERPSLKDREEIIRQLFEALRTAGLVERVLEPDGDDEVPGYQVPAAALVWRAGSGERSFHDPIRVPALPEEGGQTNAFFVDFYRHVAQGLHGMEAREHTAQVPYAEREEREERFEDARLPILYCSPTMELGVDIGSLNVVNLRNVPPTPANYAQRSGRAGRSGQPALVFTYCTTGSSHDQYFFRRPERMVAGAVSPPRLDLANEDLVRSHVHAVWLAETRLSLGKSLLDVLDVEGETPSLELHERVRAQIEGDGPRERAGQRVRHILGAVQEALGDADWYSSSWVDDVLRQAPRQFDKACDRWRSLYRSALAQFTAQTAIVKDASRGLRDKNEAKRLRREAEQQLELLTQVDSVGQSDFYSYRYFASEGFLPGYNFPRLPLSAYIPARRKRQHDEFLSRPRFLAISEFGPRAIVYHEGSQYVINKVILPVAAETPGQDDGVLTHRAKRCEQCGYLHPLAGDVDAYDVCERCGEELSVALTQLFRLENVSTKRRERITSDEEERMRLGYEIVTGVRFGEQDGRPTARMGSVRADGHDIAEVAYGNAATLWRINTGWARRKDKHQMGFVLDTERGYWATNEQAAEDPGDAMSKRTQRVIPYVEDRRNALLVTPRRALEPDQMASLQAALKQALQVHYQLEDDELAAEPLPNAGDRRQLLIYEAAEGGAGVLRRLLDAPDDLALVAREALRLCHFDPDTGDDLGQAPGAEERCEAACYDCLMSYRNQRDHALLDRLAIRDVLLELAKARVEASPTVAPRAEHRDVLDRLADSGLERRWLEFLERHGLRLPSEAQPLLAEHGTRPDFVYRDHHALVYVDGPPHDYPDRQRRDEAMTSALEDAGYWVIRFHHEDDWRDIVGRYPSVFGSLS